MSIIRRILSNPKDVFYYFQGKMRYKIYYSSFFYKLMKRHIRDQISFRILYMDSECYNEGSCKLCGCETTALQMANKSCDKPCYPVLMKEEQWKDFKNKKPFKDKSGTWTFKNNELNLKQNESVGKSCC